MFRKDLYWKIPRKNIIDVDKSEIFYVRRIFTLLKKSNHINEHHQCQLLDWVTVPSDDLLAKRGKTVKVMSVPYMQSMSQKRNCQLGSNVLNSTKALHSRQIY